MAGDVDEVGGCCGGIGKQASIHAVPDLWQGCVVNWRGGASNIICRNGAGMFTRAIALSENAVKIGIVYLHVLSNASHTQVSTNAALVSLTAAHWQAVRCCEAEGGHHVDLKVPVELLKPCAMPRAELVEQYGRSRAGDVAVGMAFAQSAMYRLLWVATSHLERMAACCGAVGDGRQTCWMVAGGTILGGRGGAELH